MKFLELLVISSAIISCSLAAESYRLPTLAKPSSYAVNLVIDPKSDTYTGSVTIILDIVVPSGTSTKTLQLHAGYNYITISKVTFKNVADECKFSSVDQVTDIATITCKNNIATGEGQTLLIEFKGKLAADDMVGLYKTTYTENSETKTLAATQFETSYARRAFPCFDEPAFKAAFTISITAPKKYTVWGNTAIASSTPIAKDNTMITVFKPTPKMSTYLVAFLISEFKTFKNPTENANYAFSVISRASAGDYTTLAVKYGPLLIDLMGEWTGLPYASLGNNKQDLAAIPDFAAGAMENWGLITYKEETLLDEKEKTSNVARQTVITVIAHELAHQWFGDYVTMNWWSETWLNEGFATYFEFYNANDVDTSLELELDHQFVNLAHQEALSVDNVASALPLSSEDADINSVAEQTKKFDLISYQKGGSIIRMIKYILGEKNFRQALQKYLTSNKYQNSKATTLLQYFDEVAPKTDDAETFSTHMNSWIYQPGYPILMASVDGEGTVTIENKKRYLLTGENATKWHVPISFTTASGPNFDEISTQWVKPNDKYTVKLKNKDDWIIYNLQSSGFYRVNYDEELWSRITKALSSSREKIHVLNRALLLNDIFNIAKIGDIDYNTTFNLARYIVDETDYYPWFSFLTEVDYLLWKIKDDATKNKLVNNTLEWLTKAIEIPSSKSQDLKHVKVLQRSLILKWACKLGHQGCIDYAKTEFESYKKNSDNIDHNLRSLIFCYGLKTSATASTDFDFLFNIYPKSNSPYEKNDVLNALACSSDKKIIEKYLQLSIAEDTQIRLQDAPKVFRAVYASGSEGLSSALDFMDKNMAEILKKYKGISIINTIMTGIANYVVKEEDIKKLQKIIEDNPTVDEIVLAGKQALEIATANKKWSDEREKGLTSALLYNGGDPVPNSATGVGLTAVLLVISAIVFIL